MRVLSWNINGVRTLPQYYPWTTLKTFDDILNHLEADIVCFQEMKSSRQVLPKQVALPPSFDSFFSFPVRKTGYSGTAVYTRKTVAVPLKAEEGISGVLQPRPPLSEGERISSFGSYPLQDDERDLDYKDLDSEGRAVVVDFGLFVLINTYCPNDGTGSEEREQFKMDYHRLLEMRVRALIAEGREVMVVGDLNACAAIEDHCEGQIMVERGLAEGLQGEEGFWGKPFRRWLRDWILNDDGAGTLVDIVRKFWPDRQGMYTCWNTKISARDTNYGTRIDFVLVTPGLVPWVKAADIQPSLKGSDHCPVYVDLHDEITNSDGSVTKLVDVLGARSIGDEPPDPPRLAARFWPEYQQKLLSTFFGKKSGDPDSSKSRTQSPVVPHNPPVEQQPKILQRDEQPQDEPIVIDIDSPLIPPTEKSTHSAVKRRLVPESIKPSVKKTKLSESRKASTKQNSKGKTPGQATLAGFFGAPKTSSSRNVVVSSSQTKKKSGSSPPAHSEGEAPNVDEDGDYLLALQLSQSDDNVLPPSSSQGSTNAPSKGQWTSLLAPTKTPNCTAHNEPAKEFTVNKPGPNKGKRFFVCARPVGPGYDKGRAERMRQHVDPQYKCDFFMWANDARKGMAKEKQTL